MRPFSPFFVGTVGVLVILSSHAARADDGTENEKEDGSGSISTMKGLLSAGYNTYVSGNMGTAASPYTSDSQGAIAVGGNVYLQNFGASTNETANGVGLAVGGSLKMTYGSVNGTTDAGGSISATSASFRDVNTGGSFNYVYGTVNGSVDAGGSVSLTGAAVNGTVAAGGAVSVVNAATPKLDKATPYTAPIDFAAVTANVSAVSNYLAAEASTPGDTLTKNANGAWVFNATHSGTNIFNVTQAQMAALSGSQVLFNSTVEGATEIINVQGTGTVNLPGNLSFGYTGEMSDSKVLLNLNGATTVNVGANAGYDLSLLAPNATVVATSGQIAGSVFAANLIGGEQLNLNHEGGVFSGALPTVSGGTTLTGTSASSAAPAPLPLAGSSPFGLAALGWFARRRLGWGRKA